MHAIWTGAIGFGLVNIPIKLYSATRESSLDLDMLDKNGHANIRYARINANSGKEVPWANIVKGYKLNDEYVVLTDDDFEKVSPKKSKMIDINEFVKGTEIDSAFYDTPYYLAPTKGGEKAYVLLREALKQSGKVAIGAFVQKMRFAEEIRDYEDLDIPKSIAVKPAELKMAQSLINQLTAKKFSMAKYKDTYDDELMKIINAKAKGKKITQPKFKLIHNKSKDLMAQLKASLDTKTTVKKAS